MWSTSDMFINVLMAAYYTWHTAACRWCRAVSAEVDVEFIGVWVPCRGADNAEVGNGNAW